MEYVLSPADSFFAGKGYYAWDGRMARTVAEFEDELKRPTVAAKLNGWANGVTIHHTYRPTLAQWQANSTYANLKGLVRTWRDTNGWRTGPHMVIAPEGIILASGLSNPGIHAGACNDDHVGIEVVGDYTRSYWPDHISELVHGSVAALCRTLGVTPETIWWVNGHRECMKGRTCPGAAIDLDQFRREIAEMLRRPAYPLGFYEALYTCITRTGPSRDFPPVRTDAKGTGFLIDEMKVGQDVGGENRWAHRADGLGFIHLGALKKV